MPNLLQILHEVSPLAAGVLLTSVWQGLLLTAAVGLGLQLLRDLPPAVRSRVWSAVLLLLLLLPVVSSLAPHLPAGGHGEVHVAERWSLIVLAAWALGSAVRAAALVRHVVGLWQTARRAVPVAVEGGLRALLAGPRRAVLCVSGEVNGPSVAGFFRPRVLLPAGLLEALTKAELEQVVLHEMEHLRRYDDWMNLLQQVSLVLLPLNPALLWLDRRLCRERELACDDGVLRATRAHKAYAACLVKLAEESLTRKGMLLALSALGTQAAESELVLRVRRILARPQMNEGTPRTRAGVGLLTAAVLAGVFGLMRSPQWVSFDARPATAAQIRMPETSFGTQGAPFMVPAVARLPQAGARTVAAVAVMNRPVVGTPRPAIAILRRRRTRMHAAALDLQRPAARMWAPVPAAKAIANAPVLQQARAAVGATPAHGQVVLTEFEVSQPLYAAVPWRGGWLIVQL